MKNDGRYRWAVQINLLNGDTERYYIEEISDLHDIVEGGPDWRLLKNIKITYGSKHD